MKSHNLDHATRLGHIPDLWKNILQQYRKLIKHTGEAPTCASCRSTTYEWLLVMPAVPDFVLSPQPRIVGSQVPIHLRQLSEDLSTSLLSL
jgi:hypothetical protein